MGERKGRLETLDMSRSIDRESYEKELKSLQTSLAQVQQAYLLQGRSAVLVFEGWDAAGKGGAIRRMSAVLDPRGFKVWPIGAPRSYYAERHYLARFWDKLPPNGAIACFDRSWYGRVLVERIEGFAPKKRWKAAYGEICDFERMLMDDGVRVFKYFLHITPDEQRKRFEARLRDPLKRWKLSYEDFRNRERWDDYVDAAEEMFAKTDEPAPWTVIPANDKKSARIAVLGDVVARLAEGVDLTPPEIEPDVLEAAMEHLDLAPKLVASLAGRTD